MVDDDLWSYKTSTFVAKPLSSSSDSGDNAEAKHSKGKRRKTQERTGQMQRSKLTTIVLDDDEDEVSASQPLESTAVQPPTTSAGPAEFELKPPPQRRRSAVVQDPETQRLLEANRRAMEQLERAAKEDPIDLLSSESEPEAEAESPRSESPASSAADDAERVELTCRSAAHGDVIFRLRRTDPYNKLFSAFHRHATEQAWTTPGAAIAFRFEGERLRGNETPKSLENDDGDIIDAIF